ncbi:MAG: Gfo/Idh/MocA family oxidoreductase [Bacteroidales bacterium]|jgi:hypothetical protein|nr:Gfo/Idh/MocA family oxidoreductase [Bacteroidales bacterium]
MNRRSFVRAGTMAGIGLAASVMASGNAREPVKKGLRAGIIGLDTSHAIAFTKSLNREDASPDFGGYKIVAAYPQGSRNIESSVKRVPNITEEVKKSGVEIVNSIKELLEKTDVIFLETNDGHPHLEQAIPVLKAGKTMFIDKPVAGSLADAFSIFQAAKDYHTPVFSSSSLRYMSNFDSIIKQQSIGRILGAETFSPSPLEKTHPDFFWYGIHGVEALFTVMGTGCKTVTRVHTPGADLVTGVWEGDRIGTFRGLREGKTGYGGYAFGEKSITTLGDYNGYDPLLKEIVKFFQTGISPVTPEETLEIFTFMEAADESKRRGGVSVDMEEIRRKALSQVKKII